MFELTQPEDPRKLFLKPGENVHFSDSWEVEAVAGKYFFVDKQRIVRRDIPLTLEIGTTDTDGYTYNLTEDTGWIPQKEGRLVEINFALKGNTLMYVKWPTTDFLFQTEHATYKPNISDATLRYLGYLDEEDIPPTMKDAILKAYLVHSMPPADLLFYNDSIVAEKIVLRSLMNICQIKEITRPPVFRRIQHFKDFL